jgi:hypothetical protein
MLIPELPHPMKKNIVILRSTTGAPPIFHQPLIGLGPPVGMSMVPGRLSPSSFICNEAECEAPEVIYGASRGATKRRKSLSLGYG